MPGPTKSIFVKGSSKRTITYLTEEYADLTRGLWEVKAESVVLMDRDLNETCVVLSCENVVSRTFDDSRTRITIRPAPMVYFNIKSGANKVDTPWFEINNNTGRNEIVFTLLKTNGEGGINVDIGVHFLLRKIA